MPTNLNPWPRDYVEKRVQQATIEAQQQGLRPALAQEVTKNWRLSRRYNIPYLGHYVHPEWEQVPGTAVQVAMMGKGGEDVISLHELHKRAEAYAKGEEVHGFGIVEQEQFSVLVAIYRRKEDHAHEKEQDQSQHRGQRVHRRG